MVPKDFCTGVSIGWRNTRASTARITSGAVIVRSPPLCQRSSGRHRPQAFDDALVEPAAHPDIPVAQVDGRVDVARPQPDPVAEPRPRRLGPERPPARARKSVVEGTSVTVRVYHGASKISKKNTNTQ